MLDAKLVMVISCVVTSSTLPTVMSRRPLTVPKSTKLSESSSVCQLIMADESDAYIDADSRTLLILFLLQELEMRHGVEQFPPVVAELLNSESKDLCLETPMTDAVVSTELLSVQLAQLVRDPYLETLYNELLNAGGIEIGIREISYYIDSDEPLPLSLLTQKVLEFNETVLGFRRKSGEIILSPDKRVLERFEAGDHVIVLAQQVYL